jgi:hypothetical protein
VKRFLTGAIIITAAAAVYGGEPGGFRTGLYLGEAAVGCAASLPPALLGLVFYAYAEDEDKTDKAFWCGTAVTGAYPFTMTLGVMGVGERAGAASSNPGTAYLVPTAITLAGAAASAALGDALLRNRDYSVTDRVALGLWCGIIPNALLNAYVYNLVKKPAAGADSSRLSVKPYVAVSRAGRGRPTPIYGLTLSF